MAFPYEYTFDFSQGMSDWSTWMRPSVILPDTGSSNPGFVRLQAPGTLDPNHIDGIGSLSLIAHLPTRGQGSPGLLDLRDAEIEITIRGHDFDAHGAKIVFWVCTTLPDGSTRYDYPVGLQITNWANTGGNFASSITDDWQTITVKLNDDPADWTEAGNFRSMHGDWGERYEPLGLAQALSRVDATLHLVAVSDTPDDRPTGFLDLASITIRTSQPAVPNDTPAPDLIVRGNEDSVASGVLPGAAQDVSFAIVDGSVRQGTVTLDPLTGTFAFMPEADFYGPDTFKGSASFQYVRIAGGVAGIAQTALVYVTPRNDAPVAAAQDENLEIARDASFAYSLRPGTDIDGDRLTFHVVDGSATHGTVVLDATTGRYSFTPDAGHVGTASFAYTVSDGQVASAAKTLTFTVSDDPFIPTFQTATTALLAGDTDTFVGQVIRLAITGDSNASYHYGNWLAHGLYVTQDSTSAAQFLRQGLSATSDAALQLAQLYIAGDGVARDYGEARTLLARIPGDAGGIFRLAMLDDLGLGAPEDPVKAAGGFLAAAKLGHVEAMATVGRRYLAGHGIAASMDDAYFWLKAALASSTLAANAGFTALLTHNAAQAAAALSPLQVATLDAAAAAWRAGNPTPVNDAPTTAVDVESAGGSAGTAIVGTLHAGSDVDGDRLSWRVAEASEAQGTVVVDARTGTYTYTPAAGFFGAASFTYVLSDGQATSEAKRVSLTVARATVALDDRAAVSEIGETARDAKTGVLANDMSIDGSSLAVVSVAGSTANIGAAIRTSHGTLVLNADGSFSFRADAEALTEGQEVTELVSYEIADGLNGRSTATLAIRIDGSGGTVLSSDGVLIGTRWGDRITGGNGIDYLVGGDGDDILDGGLGGPNTLQGGTGNDTYVVQSALDSIVEFAGEGIDTVQTALAAYTLRDQLEKLTGTSSQGQVLIGNASANVITGGRGDDQLDGGAGDDTLVGGAGNDTLIGGAGIDTADYSAATVGIIVNLASGTASGGEGGIGTLIGIERVRGSAFADIIVGDALANHFEGGDGRDYLIGGDGNDVLDGGAGEANQLQGRLGDDRYIVGTLGDTIIEFAGEGIDTVETALAAYTLREHLENLTGTAATGQTLTGNTADNTITGGTGNDMLIGGAGADSFVFTAPFGPDNVDTIADFQPGEDHIGLAATLFGGQPGQPLWEGAFATGTAAGSADHRIIYDLANGHLLYDSDGTGTAAAVLIAHLTPGLSLGASDFFLA